MPSVFTLLAHLVGFLAMRSIICGGECCDRHMTRLHEMIHEYAETFINALCKCECD